MRYLLAVLVAFVLVGLGYSFVRQTMHHLEQLQRQSFEAAKQRGELTDEQIQSGRFQDFGMELPSDQIWRIKLADSLFSFRWILITLTVCGCLAATNMLKGHP